MQDKIVIHKGRNKNPAEESQSEPARYYVPTKTRRTPSQCQTLPLERQIQKPEINPANLDIEYDENENVGIQIPQEELDEVFRKIPDLEEEEEEWNRYGISGGDDGFAQWSYLWRTGSVGVLLQKKNWNQPKKETAIAIVQKNIGTGIIQLIGKFYGRCFLKNSRAFG